jgi:membrane protein
VSFYYTIRTKLRRTADGLTGSWPGRLLVGTTAGLVRVQIFDRAMTVAAQAFTSIFPILIMVAAVFGSGPSKQFAEAADLPPASRNLLEAALGSGRGLGAFGVVGTIIVLVSATSLSRALARAYGAVWDLPRLATGLSMAWRWLATVLLLATFLVANRALGWVTDQLPLSDLSSTVVLAAADCAIAVVVPWLLLTGHVSARMLLPGGILFAVAMVFVRPAGQLYLPRALAVSGERYGPIGLAFVYVSWLYVLSFTLLLAALLGQVIARDEGVVGRFIRGHAAREPEPDPEPADPPDD